MAAEEKGSVRGLREDTGEVSFDGSCVARAEHFVTDTRFEMFMGLVVVFNIAVIIRETDMTVSPACTDKVPDTVPDTVQDSHGACAAPEIYWVNQVLLVIYTLEVSVRLYIYRRFFFLGGWNVLDFFVVIAGWVDLLASDLFATFETLQKTSNLKILKIFRLFRLVRLIRLLRAFPQLYRMVQGFASALRAMFWGIVMIFMMLCLFSLVMVQMVSFANIDLYQLDPHSGEQLLDDYCVEAMQNVFRCGLLFFQTLMAGDSWGFCAIPLIKMQWWLLLLLGSALVFVQLGFTNLVLAVIVESANDAAEADEDQLLSKRQKEEQRRSERIAKLLHMLDTDHDGVLSQQEIMDAFDASAEVRYGFQVLEIDEDYMLSLLGFLAEDGESIEVETLVSVLKKRGRDIRTRLTLLELQINEVMRLTRQLQPERQGRATRASRTSPPLSPTAKLEDDATAPLLRGADDRSRGQ